jgi:hypothetical protein
VADDHREWTSVRNGRASWLAKLIPCALVVIGLLGAARWFDLHPVSLSGAPQENTVDGYASALRVPSRADVVVVVGEIPAASTFARLDLSYGLVQLLQAELGPVRVTTLAALDANLATARALVVTASARRDVPQSTLRTFAAAGRVVVVDGDGDTLGERTLPRWSSETVGRGRIVTFDSSVARRFSTLVQGQPEDDFALVQRSGDYPDILEPDDLVRDPALRSNEDPFADRLAHDFVALLDPPDGWPIPRVLWFPPGSNGVWLSTHDEDFRAGKRCAQIAAQNQELGIDGTFFVIPVPRVADDWVVGHDFVADIERRGGAIGLHWNQYPMVGRGLGPIEPLEYVQSCTEQAERLRGVLDASARISPEVPWATANGKARTNRNHYLILRPRWSEHFRVLAANGIELDTTYGSNKGRGYLFGTARPYQALAENGLPLPIFELPFINQEDWGGADAAYFDRLFRANGTLHHGALVTLFHPHLVLETEAGRALYRSIAAVARATGHVSWTMDRMLGFWRGRLELGLTSSPTDAGLTVTLDLGNTSEAGRAQPFAIGLPSPTAMQVRVDGVPMNPRTLTVGTTRYVVVDLDGANPRPVIEFSRGD